MSVLVNISREKASAGKILFASCQYLLASLQISSIKRRNRRLGTRQSVVDAISLRWYQPDGTNGRIQKIGWQEPIMLEKERGKKPTGVTVLREIHVDRGRDDAIIPGVAPIAPEVWGPSADVINHAAEEVNLPPLLGAGTAVSRCSGSAASAGDLTGPGRAMARVGIARHSFCRRCLGSDVLK